MPTPAILIAQSGGATAVINASMAGVVDSARASGKWPRMLGARHGIEGLLRNDIIALHDQSHETINRISRTPSAALGTGRFKATDADLERCLDKMRDSGIDAFILIGGNDSADTAHRLAMFASARKQDLLVASVPKTIDNDLVETDHCPGYGSIARYLANAVRDATWDTLASPQLNAVKFIEVMGRDAGWVAAAATLGFTSDEQDLMPVVLLPERPPASINSVLDRIALDLNRRGWSVVVVPETLRTAAGKHFGGDTPEYIDPFGHPYFPSAAAALARAVPASMPGVRARWERPGTAARMSMSLASSIDLAEAYDLGAAAVEGITAGNSAFMTSLVRTSEPRYHCEIARVPVDRIANKVRALPDAFIGQDGMSTTSAFRDWAMPLLGPDPFPAYERFDEFRHRLSN